MTDPYYWRPNDLAAMLECSMSKAYKLFLTMKSKMEGKRPHEGRGDREQRTRIYISRQRRECVCGDGLCCPNYERGRF